LGAAFPVVSLTSRPPLKVISARFLLFWPVLYGGTTIAPNHNRLRVILNPDVRHMYGSDSPLALPDDPQVAWVQRA
jgi:hypothetical protein